MVSQATTFQSEETGPSPVRPVDNGRECASGAAVGQIRGSRGSPSTRSPKMLRIMFEVPPMIVYAGE